MVSVYFFFELRLCGVNSLVFRLVALIFVCLPLCSMWIIIMGMLGLGNRFFVGQHAPFYVRWGVAGFRRLSPEPSSPS